MINKKKSQAVLMSARANVFYLEHVRVCQDADRVVYLARDGEIDRLFNIPEKNTAFVLLGKGTSITDAAARKMAESGVLVGFCGSGGSPILSSVSPVFLDPHSEYRPTEYMQSWVVMWMDEGRRLSAAKSVLRERINLTCSVWSKTIGVDVPDAVVNRFESRIESSVTTTELLSSEAEWAKALYRQLSRHFKIDGFTRQAGAGAAISTGRSY